MSAIKLNSVWGLQLEGSDKKQHSLETLAKEAKILVVYFYPKDDTPGCSLENQQFTELKEEFEKYGAKLIGVSPDSTTSHEKFCGKYDLKNLLLSDSLHKLADAFGAWGEKKMYGKTYEGILRSTFVIDSTTKEVIEAWPKVSPKDHAQEVLDCISQLK